MRKPKAITIFAIAALAILVLSSLPVWLAAPFARPAMDDFNFGKFIHREGITALWKTITTYYSGWQGSFFGTILMSLHPAALFGVKAYAATGFVLSGLLLAAAFALVFTVLRGSATRAERAVIASALAFAFVQWLPHIPHALFWWNGSIYYTGSLCLVIFTGTAMLRLRPDGKWFWPQTALLCLASFCLGGTNFVTALFFVLLILSAALWLWLPWAKSPRKRQLAHTFFAFCALGGLAISVLAPGNSIRQDQFSRMHIFQTVWQSILQALADCAVFTNPALLLLLILLLPLFFRIAKRMPFTFRWPGLVIAFAFLLYASQNAPPIFATGSRAVGEGRISNAIYYVYVLWLFGSAFYLCGWLANSPLGQRIRIPAERRLRMAGYILCFAAFGTAMLLTLRDTTAFICLREVYNNRPQAFARAFDANYAVLTDSSTDVSVIAAIDIPAPLFTNHIPGTSWYDFAMAQYVGKKLVVVCPPGTDTTAYVHPLWQPYTLTLTPEDGAETLAVPAYNVSGQPYISIRALAYALRDTPWRFSVSQTDTTSLRLTCGESFVTPAAPLAPAPLDAAYDYTITIGSQTLIRSGVDIGGEPYFRWLQLSQILALPFTMQP